MGEYVRCLECGKLFRYIIWKHLKQHNLTVKKYREKYPNAKIVSERSLEKMKKFQQFNNSMKGKKNPKRTILNKLQSGKNHPNYGKSLPEEVRNKISKTKKKLFREGKLKHPWIGRKHTKESKEKNRIKHLRENLSKETLKKLSESHKGVPSHRNGLKIEEEYGKKRAKIIRQKQSEIKIGRYIGRKNPRWNGGTRVSKGYIFIYKPSHQFNVKGYVQQHRIIMEEPIGRYLKSEEEIHHINGIKKDNRVENLMLLKNKSEHMKLHKGERSGNWRGGLSLEPYPKEFNEMFKEEIRNKYGKICQLCGIKENELNGYFKKLAIHHINYVKKDLSGENLIPLCHDCNSKTSNGNRKSWTNLLTKKAIK